MAKERKGLTNNVQAGRDEVEARPRRQTGKFMALPPELEEMLKLTQNLTDEGFQDWLHDRWFRVALLTLAQMAASGNIRALDAYLKRADEWRQAKEEPKPPQPVGAVSFIPARVTDRESG